MNTNAPNILVLTPAFPFSAGAKEGSFIHDQAVALHEQGADVRVMVAMPWHRAASTAPSRFPFPVAVAPYAIVPRQILWATAGPLLARQLRPAVCRIHANWPIDIIHAHTETLGYPAVRIGHELGIPVVITVHGIDTTLRRTDTACKRRQLRNTLEHASRVVLVGTPLRDYFSQFADTGNFAIIPNGFQLPAHLVPSPRIPRTRNRRIVSVSNLHEGKGIDLTISALALLRERGISDLELVVAGGGPERAALQRLAEKLDCEAQLHFTGQLPHAEALAEILAGDVFCLPSWREAFGVVYLEAMALGKPVIGCRGQGPSDFVQHGETGLVVEPRSAPAVADALAVLFGDECLRTRLGASARTFVTSTLTWRHNAARMLALFAEVTNHALARSYAAVKQT